MFKHVICVCVCVLLCVCVRGIHTHKCTHAACTLTHKQTSKATISKLLRPSSVAKIGFLAAAGVKRCRKRCKVSSYRHACNRSNVSYLILHKRSTAFTTKQNSHEGSKLILSKLVGKRCVQQSERLATHTAPTNSISC
jgi:hypothetical protein